MKRFALIGGLLLCAALNASAQSTSIHISGGDGTSWALIRVQPGQKARVGDIQGVHIGDVAQDELIIVQSGKGSVITDPATLSAVEAARAPLDEVRAERLKVRAESRDVRLKHRSDEREAGNIDRQIERLKRDEQRGDAGQRAEVDQRIKDLERKHADMESKAAAAAKELEDINKKLEGVSKKSDEIHSQVMKKIEQILEQAKAKGLAKPIG